MYDLAVHSIDLLLCMFSSQLYAVGSASVIESLVAAKTGQDEPQFKASVVKSPTSVPPLNPVLEASHPFLDFVLYLMSSNIDMGDYAMGGGGVQLKRLFTSLFTHMTNQLPAPAGCSMAAVVDYHKKNIKSSSIVEKQVRAALAGTQRAESALATPGWNFISVFMNLGMLVTAPVKVVQSLLYSSADSVSQSNVERELAARSFEAPLPELDSGGPSPAGLKVARPQENRCASQIVKRSRNVSSKLLSERCTQLLLVLLFSKITTRGGQFVAAMPNALKEIFGSMVDKNSDIVSNLDFRTNFPESLRVDIDFSAFGLYVAKELVHSESVTLLLYCLLQYNSTFLHVLVEDLNFAGTILISLLRRMYALEEHQRVGEGIKQEFDQTSGDGVDRHVQFLSRFSPPVEPLYVTVINTLILIQDQAFCHHLYAKQVHGFHSSSSIDVGRSISATESHADVTTGSFGEHKRRNNISWRTFDNLSWYKERALGSDIALGDVALLCVLRTALHALFKLKDRYLLPNCLAIISNIGTYISNINSYTAERLVTVVQKLGKRIIETEEKHIAFLRMVEERMSREGTVDQPLVGGNRDTEWAAEMGRRDGVYVEIMLGMQEMLRALLYLFCRALKPSSQIVNIHLMYAMVRGGEAFCDIVEHPFIIDIYNSASIDSSGLVHMSKSTEVDCDTEKLHSTLSDVVHGALHKIGGIFSAASRGRNRNSSSALPPVYASATLLPLAYIPLLIRRGIRWMRRIKFLSIDSLSAPAVTHFSADMAGSSFPITKCEDENKLRDDVDVQTRAPGEADEKDPGDMEHMSAQEVRP
jgi:hypothetical protein